MDGPQIHTLRNIAHIVETIQSTGGTVSFRVGTNDVVRYQWKYDHVRAMADLYGFTGFTCGTATISVNSEDTSVVRHVPVWDLQDESGDILNHFLAARDWIVNLGQEPEPERLEVALFRALVNYRGDTLDGFVEDIRQSPRGWSYETDGKITTYLDMSPTGVVREGIDADPDTFYEHTHIGQFYPDLAHYVDHLAMSAKLGVN